MKIEEEYFSNVAEKISQFRQNKIAKKESGNLLSSSQSSNDSLNVDSEYISEDAYNKNDSSENEANTLKKIVKMVPDFSINSLDCSIPYL